MEFATSSLATVMSITTDLVIDQYTEPIRETAFILSLTISNETSSSRINTQNFSPSSIYQDYYLSEFTVPMNARFRT